MNDGLDTALVLPDVGEKPSKQYRTSPYTVRQYAALPYAQRRAVDAECDARAGLAYTTYANETSPQPFTVGRATAANSSTLKPVTPMSLSTVHPAPSPALHYLNTPELIAHDTTHPDNARTSAVAATAPSEGSSKIGTTDTEAAERKTASGFYDLAAVVSHYLTLTPTEGDTDWTHWGPSPFVRGDTHSLAVNADKGIYLCATTRQTGGVLDFVQFMEETDEAGALVWLAAHLSKSDTQPDRLKIEPVAEGGEGPACAYPGYPTGLADLVAATEQAVAPAAPAEPALLMGMVYQTTNYDLFHLLPQNRPVDHNQVKKLVLKIGQKNLLSTQPMDVTADMGIIDGQHRLAAARELGVAIYYKVGQELTEEDITILNETRKNWTGTDYLHFWAVQGRPDYVALTEFMARHPRLSFSNAKIMLSAANKAGAEEFRTGRWKAGEAYRAERVAEMVERIATEVKNFKQPTHTGFVSALFHCVNTVGGFDSKEMLRTILNQPLSLVPCASHKQWMEMLGKIYNWRKSADNQLRFE